ncbi:MAG: ATP-binding protein [Acidobacteriia bacterium]|nr:ATP-binding protein [Terriglobia bacterium]
MSKLHDTLLQYPQFFKDKLESAPKIRAAVDTTIGLVSDVLLVSKLPFFQDYTDHGYQHLSKVLEIADKLIQETAKDVCSPEDIAVLAFSILLHDLALHLSEAGFLSLVAPQGCDAGEKAPIQDWPRLWAEFLSVARHWDDRKLVEIFGADESGAPLALVRNPLDHYGNLTESDRKLIGEFIRQHHAQMAYEFAIAGFPGSGSQRLKFEAFDPELREIAGIVARSHGFALRDGIRNLEDRQISKLEQDNIHPVFLMGILRVADFLELGADRAPLIAFTYKEFKSPVSKKEWRTNQAFRAISWSNPDAESIYVPAKPKDVYSFLELRRWLQAIQSELDMAWAVMGEVYGSNTKFSKFGLTIRRVRSNITDDLAAFANLSSFVPRRVELGVARAGVLKLFIEPLYGDKPEIGIRELIQNAVDAVRERWEFEKKHGLSGSLSAPEEDDVEVWLDEPDENGASTLTVTDKGIGMTDEIITNYFLKAGASFRKSIAWKKEFETGTDASEEPKLKSQVLRSGRFGIGVLAAFLLGDRIEVATRHITSERGLRFSLHLDVQPAALELEPIQLNYDANLPVGTTIKVTVTKTKKEDQPEGLKSPNIFSDSDLWDWYCLETPSVARFLGSQKKKLKQSVTLPDEGGPLPAGWHSLESKEYRTVHALAPKVSATNLLRLVCNGIRIPHGVPYASITRAIDDLQKDDFQEERIFWLDMPSFSIFDPDGNLPLNLQREELTSIRLDFLEPALAVQARACLALLLLTAPARMRLTAELIHAIESVGHFHHTMPVFFTHTGTGLLTARNLQLAKVKRCLLVHATLFDEGLFSSVTPKYDAILVARQGSQSTSAYYSLNELNRWIASARVLTRSAERFVVGRPLRFVRQRSDSPLHLHRTWKCPHSLLSPDDLRGIHDLLSRPEGAFRSIESDFVAAELYLKDPVEATEPRKMSLGHYWKEIIREPLIPFDRMAREEQLKHAYDSLEKFFPDANAIRARIVERLNERAEAALRPANVDHIFVKAGCPHCGRPLRTPMAKQCRFCGADWHEPAEPSGESSL